MTEDRVPYYLISVHPSRINVSYSSIGGSKSAYVPRVVPEQLKNNYHSGKISSQAKRKISRSIDYLNFISKTKKLHNTRSGKQRYFRLNFITLTLSSPQVHSDQEIKSHLLHQFFIEMARKWNIPAYLWKFEKQKNGRSHCHIVTGKYIPWNELRNVWNRIQQKLGYVTRYRDNRLLWHREGFKYDPLYAPKWDYDSQLNAYHEGLRTDWDNPNSIDVHSIKSIINVPAYLRKELSKNPDPTFKTEKPPACELCQQPTIFKNGHYICSVCGHSKTLVSGRLWGCSVNLSNLEGGRIDYSTAITEEFRKIASLKSLFTIKEQYYSIYFIDTSDLRRLGCTQLLSIFEDFIKQKFPDQFPPTLF